MFAWISRFLGSYLFWIMISHRYLLSLHLFVPTLILSVWILFCFGQEALVQINRLHHLSWLMIMITIMIGHWDTDSGIKTIITEVWESHHTIHHLASVSSPPAQNIAITVRLLAFAFMSRARVNVKPSYSFYSVSWSDT